MSKLTLLICLQRCRGSLPLIYNMPIRDSESDPPSMAWIILIPLDRPSARVKLSRAPLGHRPSHITKCSESHFVQSIVGSNEYEAYCMAFA